MGSRYGPGSVYRQQDDPRPSYAAMSTISVKKMQTVLDVVSNPMGTARLLEGFATLRRAEKAEVTLRQLRVLFPDLKRCTDAEVQGFLKLGNMLSSGELRLQGRAFVGVAHLQNW